MLAIKHPVYCYAPTAHDCVHALQLHTLQHLMLFQPTLLCGTVSEATLAMSEK